MMKRIGLAEYAAAFFLVLGTTMAIAAEPAKPNLEGTWTCAAATIDGRPLAEEAAKQLRLTLTADRFKTTRGDQVLFDSTYKIDTTQTPPQIDMIGTEGDLKGKPALGIFQLDGDKLTLCYTMPGQPRPAAFASEPQSGAFLVVWKRGEK